MKKTICAVIFLLVIVLTSMAMAESANWTCTQFKTLKGTPAGFSVETEVAYLMKDAAYLKNLEEGKTWNCIVQILSRFVEVEKKMEGEDLSGDPFQYELQLKHSGHLWSFWYEVSLLGKIGGESGHMEVFTPEFNEVLAQMKDAFLPFLDTRKK